MIGIQSGPRALRSTLASILYEAEVGMPIVETIAKIRRVFFVQGKSIKAICRELKKVAEGRTGKGDPIGSDRVP